MQAVESETLILYHAQLGGEWPGEAARSLAARLPYAKRLEVAARPERAPATLAGVALALRALAHLAGRRVSAGELHFPQHGKPHLAGPADGPDFSISHSGPWVACAAVAHGLVGLDLELGTEAAQADWAAREAALKACGAGIVAARAVELHAQGAICCGVSLHARTLALFPGAAACVMTSRVLRGVEARALILEELFAA
jgi:phosphopantetheinyl transferase